MVIWNSEHYSLLVIGFKDSISYFFVIVFKLLNWIFFLSFTFISI